MNADDTFRTGNVPNKILSFVLYYIMTCQQGLGIRGISPTRILFFIEVNL